jgi:hypothetical protein
MVGTTGHGAAPIWNDVITGIATSNLIASLLLMATAADRLDQPGECPYGIFGFGAVGLPCNVSHVEWFSTAQRGIQ